MCFPTRRSRPCWCNWDDYLFPLQKSAFLSIVLYFIFFPSLLNQMTWLIFPIIHNFHINIVLTIFCSRNIQFSLCVLLLGVGIATVTDLQLNVVGSVLSLLAVLTTCVAQIVSSAGLVFLLLFNIFFPLPLLRIKIKKISPPSSSHFK